MKKTNTLQKIIILFISSFILSMNAKASLVEKQSHSYIGTDKKKYVAIWYKDNFSGAKMSEIFINKEANSHWFSGWKLPKYPKNELQENNSSKLELPENIKDLLGSLGESFSQKYRKKYKSTNPPKFQDTIDINKFTIPDTVLHFDSYPHTTDDTFKISPYVTILPDTLDKEFDFDLKINKNQRLEIRAKHNITINIIEYGTKKTIISGIEIEGNGLWHKINLSSLKNIKNYCLYEAKAYKNGKSLNSIIFSFK